MEHPGGLSPRIGELASALPILSEAQRLVLVQRCFAEVPSQWGLLRGYDRLRPRLHP